MINQYIIYGERHSGTKFLDKLISKNFQLNKAIEFGNKHFFRPQNILQRSVHQIKTTLFFCIVRNPYDWILAFHRERHHCGIMGSNDIFTFMSQEWLSKNLFLGQEILEDRHLYNNQRYKNIFDMRNNKNQFLLNLLPRYVYYYNLVRYEDFLQPNYINHFIDKISYRFNLPKASQNNVIFNNKRNYYNKITPQVLDYINNNTNWKLENQIGYIKANSVNELIL